MDTQTILAPVTKASNTIQNVFWYGGTLVNVLVTGEQTNGRYAQLEMTTQPGTEPPMHTHTREDETVYVLEGTIEYTIGEHVFTARPGDYVLLPKNIPHTFKVLTPVAKTVLTIAPAGFELYFLDPRLARPAPFPVMPPVPKGPPTAEARAVLQQMSQEFGVIV